MSRAFKRLERVLRLEKEQGYQNKAVVGGIRQFVTFWVDQARDEAESETDKALVEQAADALVDYSRLPGLEARATVIDGLLQRLTEREERLGRSEEAPARPARTRKATPARTPPPSPPPAAEQEARETPPAGSAAPPLFDDFDMVGSEAEEPLEEPPQPEPPPPPLKRTRPVVTPDPAALEQSVQQVPGVGPTIARRINTLGAETIRELLYIFPRRYDDYSLLKPINRLQYGEQVTVIGTIWETRARRTRGNQTVIQSIISDGSGKIQATWFNQPWLTNKLKAGSQIVLSGKVDQYLGRPVFNSPEWEPLSADLLRTGRIVPVYPLTSGLSSNKMRDIMNSAVERWVDLVPDPLPEATRQRRHLPALPEALAQAHFPDSHEALHAARRRLAFDELLMLQLGMLGQRRDWQMVPGRAVAHAPELLQQFTERLPFQLTGAQQRVIEEIATDMARSVPMNRLLQGDVGAGKTVVAAAAMLLAVASGAQAALMAPTEILAEQHFQGLSRLLDGLGIELRLLTGSMPANDKQQTYADLAEGTAHIAIGTHALIQAGVTFHNLALAVIDEQHRFGVDQRQALRDKGTPPTSNGHEPEAHHPHLLVMSATPIPRTLALSMYGDLDLSVLDEMPPGREEIRTKWIRPSERERAYAFVRGQVGQGRQAFIICPLVEESDKIEAKSAVEEHARLQEQVFPDLKLGLLHGRMKGEEKEQVMRTFYNGETQILVSTSVIEVGVDVPNSTVMLIEGANRFGLAQLHQFRGRVGRGEHQSYCLLVSDTVGREAEERLQALEKTNDGFLLAEKDLELRGPGQFFGRRQSGLPELKLASLLDVQLLEEARAEAEAIIAADALLQQPEHRLLQEQIARFWASAADVS